VPGYEVLDELGRGGMGVVYRARQVRAGRLVALKMILSGAHANPAELSRFLSEAEAIARLQHPNIVQVFEVGEHQGVPYFSLEYCPHGSLDRALRATPLAPGEAAALVEKLARAMDAAHQKGLIHRDLKPANVLLADDGTPKITDFGLAKKADGAGQTASGTILGTPSYMAPEQADNCKQVGPAADVYSLGAILYECLTGRPPFRAEAPLDTILQVLNNEPVPPRQLQSKAPRDLDTICLHCLEKAPGKRYPSAWELAEDLRRFRSGEPIRARTVGSAERAWRWCRRNPAVTSVVGSVLGLLVVIALGAWWAREELRARSLVETLLTANTDRVPELIHDLGPYRPWVDPLLRAKAAEEGLDEGRRLHVSLALLPVDASQAEYLGNRLLAARGPEEVKVVRELLEAHAPDSATKFWPVLEDDAQERSRRLRAACALARFAGGDPRWAKVGNEVVRCLAGENVLLLRDWSELLEPVRGHLVPHQVRRLGEPDAWNFAAFLAMLRAYPEDAVVALQRQLDDLARFREGEPPGEPMVRPARTEPRAPRTAKPHLERAAGATAGIEGKQALDAQQTQAAVALLHLGRPERAWPLFHQGPDPTCRTYLIHRCAALGVDPAVLANHLLEEKDSSIRQGLLLALGEYKPDQRADVVRGPLMERLRKDYRDDPDPGVHAGVEWLLHRWGQELARASPGPPRGEAAQPRWYVNGQGQTFAVIPPPGPFEVGSPPDERGRLSEEDRRRVQIDYPFAVALKLVTVAEFRKFRPGFEYQKQLSPGEDTPINSVTWYEAAAYCNWLSAQEKIPKDEWCYEPNAKGEYAEGMKVKANYQAHAGYRLPREAEWEYACRAGTVTPWTHGSDQDLLGHYAWYALNANSAMHPVGTLKPNGLGLFDAHGNAWQWCHDVYEKDNNDNKCAVELNNKQFRILRGGSFYYLAGLARSAYRIKFEPAFRGNYDGFRVARTYRLEKLWSIRSGTSRFMTDSLALSSSR
jgi:formylglycine-generating enzyme required for sulfatase activity